jgi:hypothetical protein
MPPSEIVIEDLSDFWEGIAIYAGDDIRRLNQFAVPNRGSIGFGICNVRHFCWARVQQIVIDLINFLPVNRLPNFSAAVITLHAFHL